MHASSLENMQTMHDRYILPALSDLDVVEVLDVGGADVNGGYRETFDDPRYRYRTVDVEDGEGVDVVLDDPYVLPLRDDSVDVVLSGQMLEHCEFFWLTFGEMIRVLKPTGLLVLIAPSAGAIHRYPVDCYRFYPDAYHALAKWTGCHVVEVFHDQRGPWQDLVGVFSKVPAENFERGPARAIAAPVEVPPATEAEEATSGTVFYIDVLARLHERLSPELYLEVGIRHGKSLHLAKGPAVAIDPAHDIRVELPSTTTVHTVTSDEFFQSAGDQALPGPIDLALIDGMHLFEYALRDFMNVERRSRPGALIVVDDIYPNHPAQAERDRRTRVWTGDVWKLHAILEEYRPDLVLLPIDTQPTGLLLVAGADPDNRRLWELYNTIVRRYSEKLEPPAERLERAGVISPTSPLVDDALAIIADRSLKRPRLVNRLRALKKGAGIP